MSAASRHPCPYCCGTGTLEHLPRGDAELAAKAEGLRHACAANGALVTGDGRTDERGAALVVGFAPKTLSNWRAAHCPIPYIKRRGRVLYAFTDLARFLAENDNAGEK